MVCIEVPRRRSGSGGLQSSPKDSECGRLLVLQTADPCPAKATSILVGLWLSMPRLYVQ